MRKQEQQMFIGLQSASLGESGLTLVEVLMVSLLLALMSGILYTSLHGIIRGKKVIDEQSLDGRTVQHVLGRITGELTSRMLLPLNTVRPGRESSSKNKVGSNIYLLGAQAGKGEERKDSLRFVSVGASQHFFGAFPNYGPVELEYRLEENPEKESSSFDEDSPGAYVLVREEYPATLTNKKILEERRVVFPLLENVTSLGFRFLKAGKWQDKWDTPRALPEAVEITIGMRGESLITEVYKTVVGLNRATQ